MVQQKAYERALPIPPKTVEFAPDWQFGANVLSDSALDAINVYIGICHALVTDEN
jgi:hypothetical protein